MMFNDEYETIRLALMESMQTFDAQGDHLSATQCDEALTVLARVGNREINDDA